MDQTPDWRAFEPPSPPAADTQRASQASAPPRRWLIAGSLAVAALALAVGGLLAASAPAGSVGIDAGDPGSGPAAEASVVRGDGIGPRPSDTHSAASGIVVDVEGAVVRPGVYHLAAGSRVGDAVAAAGGFGPRLDAQEARLRLNLAARLADGDQVRVPSLDDEPGPASPGSSAGTAGGLVDLNRATAAELDALPGIGPVTSAKILAARATQPFRSLDELVTRKVLSASTLEKIRDLVTVGG